VAGDCGMGAWLVTPWLTGFLYGVLAVPLALLALLIGFELRRILR
jgi:hypothetical protein